MKFAFFATILVSWLWAHWYAWRRTSSVFGLGRVARLAMAGFLGLLSVAWPLARFMQRFGDGAPVQVFQDAGSLWMGFFCVLMLVFVAVDVVILLPAWIAVRRRRMATGLQRFVRKAAFVVAAGCAVVVSGVAMANAGGPIVVTRQELSFPDLPESLDGFSLLFLSDVHMGGLVGTDDLDRIETAVRSVRFDRIMFVGDLTDQENGGDGSAFRRMAGWARLGDGGPAIAVSGNHDRYTGGDSVLGLMSKSGMTVLRQDHVCVSPALCFAGVDDPSLLGPGVRSDVALISAVAGVPRDAFTILLSHQPIRADLAASLGVDLMLSGHTHHGQFPPAVFFTPLFYPYWAGLYHIHDMYLYVTAGAGFWGPPLRLGSRAEVVNIILKKAVATTD